MQNQKMALSCVFYHTYTEVSACLFLLFKLQVRSHFSAASVTCASFRNIFSRDMRRSILVSEECSQYSLEFYSSFYSQLSNRGFFLFFPSLFRWKAFSLWWVWDEIHPEVSHGETQEDSQWREAIPVWLLSPGTLLLFALKLVHQVALRQLNMFDKSGNEKKY